MDTTSDLARVAAEIADYLTHADRVQHSLAAGAKLTQGLADALSAATGRSTALLNWAFEIAERDGIDFFTIECEGYTICQSFEGGRWEAFTTFAA